jgi:hypothetical protein
MISRLSALTGALALLVSCGFESIDEHSCPPGSTLTYESFGRGFLGANCQRCHGARGPDRQGAPSGYDFGTAEDARAWRERIYARAAGSNTTMPPGPDDPPAEEREKLADWLSCGAP